MITIDISPILFQIGHVMIRWYGVIVLIAILLGIWITAREAARYGMKKEDIYDIAAPVIVFGVAGARIVHVLDHWGHEFAAAPWRAFYVWEGGLAIWGGVLGGLLAVVLLAKRRGWPLSRLLDAAAPGLVLAQAVGRVACIITGDAMGKPTTGPFGVAYTNSLAMVPELGVYYTPMPVYEIVANLGIFSVLWLLRKRNLPVGVLFLVYLSLYSLARFFLAFTSSYQELIFGLTQSQVIALVSLSAASILLIVKAKLTLVNKAFAGL